MLQLRLLPADYDPALTLILARIGTRFHMSWQFFSISYRSCGKLYSHGTAAALALAHIAILPAFEPDKQHRLNRTRVTSTKLSVNKHSLQQQSNALSLPCPQVVLSLEPKRRSAYERRVRERKLVTVELLPVPTDPGHMLSSGLSMTSTKSMRLSACPGFPGLSAVQPSRDHAHESVAPQ